MSSVRLLLSGSLVAGGLILGAFTLHGYFDPQWRQKQAASLREPAREPTSINTFQGRTVVTPAPRKDAASRPRKVRAKPAEKSGKARAVAARAAARRRLAQKKRAERQRAEKASRTAKAKPQAQQATLQWPWNWLGK